MWVKTKPFRFAWRVIELTGRYRPKAAGRYRPKSTINDPSGKRLCLVRSSSKLPKQIMDTLLATL